MTDLHETKRALHRAAVYATEAAGRMDQGAFAEDLGLPGNWFVDAYERTAELPLEQNVAVYDAAAVAAGWSTMAAIVRRVTDLQRYREWDDGSTSP